MIYSENENIQTSCFDDVIYLSDRDLPPQPYEFILGNDYAEKLDDQVNHPSHYTQGKVECIDALESATINLKGIDAVCTANAIKYLWRWKEKGGLRDLKKAKWYLDRLITQWENHETIY